MNWRLLTWLHVSRQTCTKDGTNYEDAELPGHLCLLVLVLLVPASGLQGLPEKRRLEKKQSLLRRLGIAKGGHSMEN